MFPKRTLYFLRCSTGCSCCRSENHDYGPLQTLDEAKKTIEGFKALPRLASQFSKTGHYSLYQIEAEILPDGRLICGQRILENDEPQQLGDGEITGSCEVVQG